MTIITTMTMAKTVIGWSNADRLLKKVFLSVQ